jgi:hypothetical protein
MVHYSKICLCRLDTSVQHYDVVILGAGAAGMMCALEAGNRGRDVLLVEHAKNPGEKIRISGGGRCNFTNLYTGPENFLSGNPHFCKSALKRYTQHDFIDLIVRSGIAYHEKTRGQLFCDGSSRQVVELLVGAMKTAGVELALNTSIEALSKSGDGFQLRLSTGSVSCRSLVVATGGKSIPKMGATGFGYRIAEQFDLAITETRPALVPLTFDEQMLAQTGALSGVSVDTVISGGGARFEEAMLFTHRGLSGPAILQISSYWREGGDITVSMLPHLDMLSELRVARSENGRQSVQTALAVHLPRRLAQMVADRKKAAGNIADCSDRRLAEIADAVQNWRVRPIGSEGYRTAEVTLGGIDTAGLDSRTMEAKTVPGLYFVGEVVDVTGWLGGFNFQWAWSSGWAAGQAV